MKTVAAIYSAPGMIEPIKKMFKEIMPEYRLINVLDDALVPDVLSAKNEITTNIRRRMLAYCHACENMNADVILSTCSAMGDVIDQIRPFCRLPILRIDEPMVTQAMQKGSAIAVLMTNSTTVTPTTRLVRQVANTLGKQVRVIEGLASEAFVAFTEGNQELHDKLLLKTAVSVAENADVIILAQGSMARMQEEIARVTGKPVFSSLHLGLLSVHDYLKNKP